MQTLLMQKLIFQSLQGLSSTVKYGLTVKKSRFFEVEDTLTIMLPREKTHLSHLSSALKTFQGHLRYRLDNLKKLDFSIWWILSKGIFRQKIPLLRIHYIEKSNFFKLSQR